MYSSVYYCPEEQWKQCQHSRVWRRHFLTVENMPWYLFKACTFYNEYFFGHVLKAENLLVIRSIKKQALLCFA